MSTITKIFNSITSNGGITIVQKGFLYSDRVDTRENELILKDFVTLARYLLKNKYLSISFKIEGKENADDVLMKLKKLGISVEVLRNELFWIIELDQYEVDLLLTINLPEEQVKKLIEEFYVVVDAVLVYPVGYISWGSYFNQKKTLSHA